MPEIKFDYCRDMLDVVETFLSILDDYSLHQLHEFHEFFKILAEAFPRQDVNPFMEYAVEMETEARERVLQKIKEWAKKQIVEEG